MREKEYEEAEKKAASAAAISEKNKGGIYVLETLDDNKRLRVLWFPFPTNSVFVRIRNIVNAFRMKIKCNAWR